MEKTFKILVINGGGVRILYSLYLLQAIEEMYCSVGTSLSDYFDMIVGTSAGSMVAAGISLWKSEAIAKLIRFFESECTYCFNDGTNCLKTLLNHGYLYNKTNLITAITRHLRYQTMNDFDNLVCIPAYNLDLSSGHIFRTPYQYYSDDKANVFVKDAVIASCSAPLYFNHHLTKFGRMVDGGIWMKDLTEIAVSEFRRVNDYLASIGQPTYDKCLILNIKNIEASPLSIRKICSQMSRIGLKIAIDGLSDYLEPQTMDLSPNIKIASISSELFGYTNYIRLDQVKKLNMVRYYGKIHANLLRAKIVPLDLSVYFMDRKKWREPWSNYAVNDNGADNCNDNSGSVNVTYTVNEYVNDTVNDDVNHDINNSINYNVNDSFNYDVNANPNNEVNLFDA